MMSKNKLTGRESLRISGAAFVAVAGGSVWRAIDQGVFTTGKGSAYELWQNWQSETTSSSLALIKAAILAATECVNRIGQ